MAHGGVISVDDDLDDAWAKVVNRFEQEARLNLTSRKTLSIDDVLTHINPKDAAPDTKAKAKAVVRTVLSCVQRFGDILASASSVAFGGSQQCFNALNFVITATQKYGKIFEDLTTLIERVSVFLETLRIYLDENDSQTKLDKRLRPNIYRVLEHFMTILTLATRLTTRSGKAKVFAKVFFFGEDSGMTEALATLETRVSDVVRIQVAVIGKDLSEAARDIRVMKGDMDLMLEYDKSNAEMLSRLDTQESRKISDDTIRSWLNINLIESERDRQVKLNEERVPGTGSWLLTGNEHFVRWCDVNTSGSSTILITGERGRGKTFLASAVVEHLRESLVAQQTAKQIALAYFYAQEDSIRHGGLSQMNRALRSMVWQLATSNSDFYEFVLGCSRKNLNINTSDQMWDILFAGYSPKFDTVFYLVVDGIEAPVVGQSSPNLNCLQTRIFITGSSQAVRGFRDPSTVVQISLGSDFDHGKLVANFEDVQKLVRLRLSSMPIFRQDTSLSNRQEQQRVFETVSGNIQNDFSRLDLVFRELERCVNLRQLDEILEQVNEPIQVKITRQIEVLNQMLTQDEILEVNTIISCMASFSNGTHRPKISLVEQYVDIILRASRLVPLKGQIETKYHHLFVIEAQDTVSWRYDEMEDYLTEYHVDDNTIKEIYAKRGIRAVGSDLEELDLLEKIVQTNLTNVLGTHGSELFDRYGFAEFFRSKRGQHKESISFDKEKSQVLALWVGLKVLCEGIDSAHVGHVRLLARQNIVTLLTDARIEQATAEEAVQIGLWLVQLLRDVYFIDTWINDPEWSKSMQALIKGDRFAKEVSDWMTTPGVADSINDVERRKWLQVCKEEPFRYATVQLLLRWVTRGTEETRDMIALRPHGTGPPEKTYKWLCEWLPECHWGEITRLLVEFYGKTQSENRWVLETCETVLKTESNSWWALFFAAQSYYEMWYYQHKVLEREHEDDEHYIPTAYKYLNIVKSLELFEDESYTAYYWQDMLPILAKCQLLLQDLTGAQRTYLRMLDDARGMHFLTAATMNDLEPSYLVEYLKTIAKKLVPGNPDKTCFQYWTNTIADLEDTFVLRVAAHHDGNWQFIARIIECVTTSDASRPKSMFQHLDRADRQRSELEVTLAHIFWYESGDATLQDRALAIWQQHDEYEPIIDALLDRTRPEVPSERFNSPDSLRIHKIIRSVEDRETSLRLELRMGLITTNWQRLSGDLDKAQATIGTLLEHHGYTSGSCDNKLTFAGSIIAWGLACLALGNDELGVSLLRQRASDPQRQHVGCNTVCGKPNYWKEKGVIYVCRDCMHFIPPRCLDTLKQQRGIIKFCHPDHDFVALKYPNEEPDYPDRSNGWTNIYDYDGQVYDRHYEPHLEPLRRAQALYGWRFEFPEEPPAATDDLDEDHSSQSSA